jgi:hypothetical protein
VESARLIFTPVGVEDCSSSNDWSSRVDFETHLVLNLFMDQDRLCTVDEADLNDLTLAEAFLVKTSR